jgi:signal recognition particle GTPase
VDAALGADATAADLDARAAKGELNFKDFLTMASAYSGLGGKQIPGMPKLSAKELLETQERFSKHEKIVDVMLEEERNNPELLVAELKEMPKNPGPRIQRLATATGEKESEVGLFLMQFEAMRESTRRIAAGEDPDAVVATEGLNRAAKRAAKKRAAKAKKKG